MVSQTKLATVVLVYIGICKTVQLNMKNCRGSCCGSVDSAIASDTRGPRFESSHRQLLFNFSLLLTDCRKDENKEK